MTDTMDIEAWLRYGHQQGFCSPPVCVHHDGLGTTAAEDTDTDDGGDPCLHSVRLYPDAQTKAEVEANHPPSVWRASNQGWS